MSFAVRRKASFLVPSGPKDLLHLHVVLTNAAADGFHLVATVGSIKEGTDHDPACVIEPGEHDFITLRSIVIYALAETMRGAHITAMIAKNYYKPRKEVSDALCTRICEGLLKSDRVRPRVVDYYRKNEKNG